MDRSQPDVSVGTASGPTEKLLPQVLGFWWIEKLGRISYGLRDGFGMNALEVSEPYITAPREALGLDE